MKLKSFIIFILIALTGCSGMQNLRVEDIQKEEYLYNQFKFDKSLDQVEIAVYKYSTSCRTLGSSIMRNPVEKNKAKLIVEGMGFTSASVVLVLDFEETAPNETTLKAYSCCSGNKTYIERVVKAINSPEVCD